MANQKMNIGKITEKDVPSFTKGITSAKETITGNLGKDNVVGNIRSVATGRFEKVALEPAVDFINSSKLNRKTFVNCVVKPSVMSWRFTDGIIGLSRNDIIDGLRNLGERLRGVEARDRANANLVVRGFESFVERFFDVGGGGYVLGDFKVEVNPDGGIDVSYAGVSGVFVSSTRAIAVSLSYTLKRKEKNGSTWIDITSGECRSGFSITDMGEGEPLKLNTEYTYHLSIKILNAAEIKASKDTYELERDVLYKALDVRIVDFTAEPDPIERRVNLKFDVKNYTEIRVVREDTKKELENIYRDFDVTAGGTYRYFLYASNAWYNDGPKEAVADCTNVLPTAGKLTCRMENTVRGVVLFMETIKNGFVTAIERHKQGLSENDWELLEPKPNQQDDDSDELKPIANQKNYKDYDDSIYPGTTLVVGETYDYRVTYSNKWGKTSNSTVSVKMVNETYLPPMPRMLPPKYAGETIRWTTSDKAKSYEVKRYDNSNEKDFYKIDSGAGDVECDRRWPEKKDEIKIFNNVKDNQIQKNVQYLYKITARNAWGEAVSYRDVFVPENQKGKDDVGCYKYIGQNTNDAKHTINFQGITTDGECWYLTAGCDWNKGYADLNKPSIYKGSVAFSLNENISRYRDCEALICELPDLENVHVGDLDCFGDYLFVAVYKYDDGNYDQDPNDEDIKHYHGQIWIFNKHTLKRITTVKIRKPDGSYIYGTAWCAVNPCDKRLYTSPSNFYDGIIYSYKINFDNIRRTKNGEKGLRIFSDPIEVRLFDDGKIFMDGALCDKENNENHFVFTKESMQGGCFDYYNNLYLNSGYQNPAKVNPGIQVFKLVCDENATLQNVLSNTTNDEERAKKYEAYQSGDWNGSCSYRNAILVARSENPYRHIKGLYIAGAWGTVIREDLNSGFIYQFNVCGDEEPEGLVYCDFNYTPRKPMKQDYVRFGSFHASLLKNSGNVDWEYMWFKHYNHVYRETVEKHVSYSSSFVVIDSVRGDYKIVDNGILVKRFKTSETANKALNVLKNFKKDNRIGNVIYTIGWLCTSDSNHNYEFDALKLDGKGSLANQADCVIEYEYSSENLKTYGDQKGDPLERYIVRLIDKNGVWYHFLAHNRKDAYRIQEILKGYKRICIVGVGPDSDSQEYFSGTNFGYRIRSEYNLIWLEK